MPYHASSCSRNRKWRQTVLSLRSLPQTNKTSYRKKDGPKRCKRRHWSTIRFSASSSDDGIFIISNFKRQHVFVVRVHPVLCLTRYHMLTKRIIHQSRPPWQLRLIRRHAVLRALPTAVLRPPTLSTTPRQPWHVAPSSCRIQQLLPLCPRLQRFVSPRSATRHCRGGSLTIIHRRPGSNQAWLSARITQRCGQTSMSRQLASLSRRHCNALCSTVSIALPIRESRLVWHSSSVPIGGKVSARTLPDGQSRVKLVVWTDASLSEKFASRPPSW